MTKSTKIHTSSTSSTSSTTSSTFSLSILSSLFATPKYHAEHDTTSVIFEAPVLEPVETEIEARLFDEEERWEQALFSKGRGIAFTSSSSPSSASRPRPPRKRAQRRAKRAAAASTTPIIITKPKSADMHTDNPETMHLRFPMYTPEDLEEAVVLSQCQRESLNAASVAVVEQAIAAHDVLMQATKVNSGEVPSDLSSPPAPQTMAPRAAARSRRRTNPSASFNAAAFFFASSSPPSSQHPPRKNGVPDQEEEEEEEEAHILDLAERYDPTTFRKVRVGPRAPHAMSNGAKRFNKACAALVLSNKAVLVTKPKAGNKRRDEDPEIMRLRFPESDVQAVPEATVAAAEAIEVAEAVATEPEVAMERASDSLELVEDDRGEREEVEEEAREEHIFDEAERYDRTCFRNIRTGPRSPRAVPKAVQRREKRFLAMQAVCLSG